MRRILVATDGSQSADRAIDTAADLAEHLGAKLIILTVGNDPSITEGIDMARAGENLGDLLEAKARRVVANAAERARKAVSDVEIKIGWGDVAETILEFAKRDNAELIVIGRRGLGRLARLLMGGVSQKIVALASCPVMVIP
jgi:nucleotide-binding universal stress UspA family protein